MYQNYRSENTDLKHADLENTDVENAVYVLVEKLHPFTPNGTKNFKTAPKYHRGRFKIDLSRNFQDGGRIADFRLSLLF